MEDKAESKEAVEEMERVFGNMTDALTSQGVKVKVRGAVLAARLTENVERRESQQKRATEIAMQGQHGYGCVPHIDNQSFAADKLFIESIERDRDYVVTVSDLRQLFGERGVGLF